MSDLERTPDDELRSRAIAILKKRRDFRAHLLVYVLVNGALVTIWAVTNPDTFFWPVFFLVFWGIGVVMNGWDAYFANDFSEEKIERQMHRLQPH
jgi:predicted membrane channel-forming protein YqfA (hemolysin III family)